MKIEVIKPFGPTIVKLKVPNILGSTIQKDKKKI